MAAFQRIVRDAQLDYLWAKYPHTCVWCGLHLVRGKHKKDSRNYVTIDHYMPTSLGGPNIVENMFLSCRRCNQCRGNLGANRFAHACLLEGKDINVRRLYNAIKQNRLAVQEIPEYTHLTRYLKDKEHGLKRLIEIRKNPWKLRVYQMKKDELEAFLIKNPEYVGRV